MGDRLILTTDGGMRKGTAGWAWVAQWYGQTEIVQQRTGIETESTNQRAELLAVIHSLMWGVRQGPSFMRPQYAITVVSDSAYVVNCFRDRWYEKWEANGWISSGGKPVANRDLWEDLLRLVRVATMPLSSFT